MLSPLISSGLIVNTFIALPLMVVDYNLYTRDISSHEIPFILVGYFGASIATNTTSYLYEKYRKKKIEIQEQRIENKKNLEQYVNEKYELGGKE